jgi:hypothetical protein
MHRPRFWRAVSATLLLWGGLAACTPFIPVKDDFGVSATVPAGEIPPEFAEFNAYNPGTNPLLADQMCATPYQPFEEKNLAASGGRIVQAKGRCATHRAFFGNDPLFGY